MKRKTLESAITAVLVVAIVALAVVVGPNLLPPREGEIVGGVPTSQASTGTASSVSSPGTTEPLPAATSGSVRAGCFDPAASPAPVVFTNPDGTAGAEAPDDNPVIGAARTLPTFAGVWVSQFRRQVHIALTCDIDGAIDEIGHLVPRGLEVHFHLVQYSYAELERIRDRLYDDHDALLSEGIWLGYGGIDEIGNRVEIGIDPLTPAIVEQLRARYGDPIEFGHAPRPEPVPSRLPGEREIVVAVVHTPDQEPMVTCGGPAFPAAVLEEPDVEDVPADLAQDLVAAARFWVSEFPGIEQLTWRLAYRDDTSALFVAKSNGDGWTYLTMERDAEGWTPSGAGGCRPTPVFGELGPAEWALDPAFPTPGPGATELHVLVMEQGCASGEQAFGRIEPPLAQYGADSLTLKIGLRRPSGAVTCPSHPPTPATVILPEPLGDRILLDGGRHPPAPPSREDW